MNNAKLKVVLTAILLVFAIVPALVVGAVGTFSFLGHEASVKTDTLSAVSKSKAVALDQLFSYYTSTVSTLAKTEVVIEAANGGTDADSVLKSVVDTDKDFVDLMIVATDGDIIASAKGNTGLKFEHFSDTGLASVSGALTWNNYGSADAFYVAKDIYDNTAKCGYAIAIVSLGADSNIAAALSGEFLDGGHMVLFDESGKTVNFGNDMSVKNDASVSSALADMRSRTSSDGSAASQNVITGSFGEYTYACGALPGVGAWRWAGLVKTGTFTSYSAMSVIIGWGVVLAACAVASFCAWFIINRFINQMQDMLRTMDAISEEDNGYKIRFTLKNGNSELARIKESFNDMLDEVMMSEERHRTIAELSDNMLFEWDFHKESMYVSQNAHAKFNIDTDGATLSNGRFIDALMPAEDAEKYKRDISQLLRDKNGYSAEYQLKAKSGTVIWVSLRAVCITDRLGEPLRVIGVMTDIDNEKKMELQLSERASFDFLSQLYNRNTFTRNLVSELERRGANKLALLFIDVDDFKFINDRYGHTIGDEVIKYVADTIRLKVDNKGGFAGRFGGDEFVLCFTDQEDIENIENISMDIINELYSGYTTSDGSMTINVKASIGIALCPEHSEDCTELLAFSDTAMYFVKKNGKTNYHMYCPEDTESGEYIDPEF